MLLDTSDDDDSNDAYKYDDDESEYSTSDDEYEKIDETEKEECDYITSYLDNYAVNEEIFSAEEMNSLKEREQQMNERNENSYYRCKEKHAQLYHDLTQCYAPFITRKNIEMLCHPYDTQKNEAMNTSVASYAPKNKTYSLTDSLQCRVAIAAGVQILGYEKLWEKIFLALGLTFDDNLRSSLQTKDTHKVKKSQRAITKVGKIARGRARSEKFSAAKREYFEQLRTGMAYESGIALKEARKVVKNLPSNRSKKGTPTDQLRCKYFHPNYCTKMGHRDARSKACFANRLTKEERAIVLDTIFDEAVQNQMATNTGKCPVHVWNDKMFLYIFPLLYLILWNISLKKEDGKVSNVHSI